MGPKYTDPAIVSRTAGKYGYTDTGLPGMQAFFANHTCNHLCRSQATQLYLARLAKGFGQGPAQMESPCISHNFSPVIFENENENFPKFCGENENFAKQMLKRAIF